MALRDRNRDEVAFLDEDVFLEVAFVENLVEVDVLHDLLTIGIDASERDAIQIGRLRRPGASDRRREAFAFVDLHVAAARHVADDLHEERGRSLNVNGRLIEERGVLRGIAFLEQLLQRILHDLPIRRSDPRHRQVAVDGSEPAGGGDRVV